MYRNTCSESAASASACADKCKEVDFDVMSCESNGILLDMTRSCMLDCRMTEWIQKNGNQEMLTKLISGGYWNINTTEQRLAYHMALRAERGDSKWKVNGKEIVPEIYEVLDSIKSFSEKIRSGDLKGVSGKQFTDIISVGIGGSYLGTEFVYEAIRTHKDYKDNHLKLHFLANVDPIDLVRATEGCDPETTLVIIISKTFTTAETLANARAVQKWMATKLEQIDASWSQGHFCAVSNNVEAAKEFGLKPTNCWKIWDWVGGRFSVTSAVGILPLALSFGFGCVEQFLAGARDVDENFLANPSRGKDSLAVRLALSGLWNVSRGFDTLAILPYCQSLARFPAHIQQVMMESNGKRVDRNGNVLDNALRQSSPVVFGEPGTNGQHSFYQMLHQGRPVPCEFIGFTESQTDDKEGHDELMANLFAQADGLFQGKTLAELKAENCPDHLLRAKECPGGRPSVVILFKGCCDARNVGKLLALYEDRIVVEGWVYGLNSFDQFGVELGKGLAKKVRAVIDAKRTPSAGAEKGAEKSQLTSNTQKLLDKYVKGEIA